MCAKIDKSPAHPNQARAEDAEAEAALHMATFSLKKMAAGGMYDHIGGGFHRYSVDEYFHVPHVSEAEGCQGSRCRKHQRNRF